MTKEKYNFLIRMEGSPEIIDCSSNKDEIYFVRRALSHHLASGLLPVPMREVNNSNKENYELSKICR